jgi:D-alanyl-D-alanine carboxypeptidase (penicillin-binding protein 5/6)
LTPASPWRHPPVWKGKSPTGQASAGQKPSWWRCPLAARQAQNPGGSPDPLVAPFAKGQQVGSLKVLLGEQTLVDVDIFEGFSEIPKGFTFS